MNDALEGNWKDLSDVFLEKLGKNHEKLVPTGAPSEIRPENITSIEQCHHTMMLVVYSAVSVIHKTM